MKESVFINIVILCFSFYSRASITLSMIVKNEADRYLKQVLTEVRHYIDAAVILDDASTDNTVAVCCEMLRGIKLKVIVNQTSMWETNESVLRQQQWNETIATNPEWILNLDADEIPEKAWRGKIRNLTKNSQVDAYSFRLFDFWSENHFRSDAYWSVHKRSFVALVHYRPNVRYEWSLKALHCGRWPINVHRKSHIQTELRIKHMGWANPMDRQIKYDRYLKCDPLGKTGCLQQYRSILDKNVKLEAWQE